MDMSYSDRGSGRKKRFLPVVIGFILLLVITGSMVSFANRRKLLSPIPEIPAYEIIFYTPTPMPVSPTSSPSATPKAAQAKATAKPSPNPTATPAVSASPTASVTPKP